MAEKQVSLIDRLKKNSTISDTQILSQSEIYNNKKEITTPVPMVNVALSGSTTGGMTSGLLLLCGMSKMFKTGFGLLMAKSFQIANPDGVILFYDSEFGSPPAYWASYGIDMNRVLHCPIMNIEQFKFDIMKQLNDLGRDEKVFVLVDSIGNLASIKEVDDALEEKAVADMTRAKQLKSVFRMVTPFLTMKNISLVAINHIYMTQEKYSKAVVSGGTGIYLSADNIWIISRQTDKDGQEIQGYNFVITIEKSRHVKEKTKIPISISYKEGIDKYSGIFDLAIESGLLVQAGAWYKLVDLETGEVADKNVRAKDIDNKHLAKILACKKFTDFIEEKYKLSSSNMLEDDGSDDEAVDYLDALEDDED